MRLAIIGGSANYGILPFTGNAFCLDEQSKNMLVLSAGATRSRSHAGVTMHAGCIRPWPGGGTAIAVQAFMAAANLASASSGSNIGTAKLRGRSARW
jgi:hypothetical protein